MISYSVILMIRDEEAGETAGIKYYHVPHCIVLCILSALECFGCGGTVLDAAGTLWSRLDKDLSLLRQSPFNVFSDRTGRGKGSTSRGR